MKKAKLSLFVFVPLVLVFVSSMLTGCSQASNVTTQLKNDANEFEIYRKVTAINLRTDTVIFEIEGYISYTVESDGDFSIIAKVGEDKFVRDVVGLSGDGITYVVEQLEPKKEDPYNFEVRIYARLPEITVKTTD
jgi:hypothetical protein